MIVAVVGLKGGVGKTTTAVFLAEAAAGEGPVLLVDLDPQGSARRWSEDAPEGLSSTVIGLGRTVGRDLARIGRPYTHVIIDTPPGDVGLVDAAIRAAHVAVVPVGSSLVEVDRLTTTLEMAESAGTPAAVLLVRMKATRLARDVVEALEAAKVPVLDAQIPSRTAIEGAFGARPVVLHSYDQAWLRVKAMGER